MNDFDVDKPLPSVIAIKCAENHLYRIGLSLFSFGYQIRKGFHNPLFTSFIICVQILHFWNYFKNESPQEFDPI